MPLHYTRTYFELYIVLTFLLLLSSAVEPLLICYYLLHTLLSYITSTIVITMLYSIVVLSHILVFI